MEAETGTTLQVQEDQEPTVSRSLFGGAILCSIPARFEDMSKFREVPDFQEVFNDISTDQCIIVELLSLEEPGDSDEKNSLRHFKLLAEDNDDVTGGSVISHSVIDLKHLHDFGQNASAYFVFGNQSVAKFKEHVRNSVNIYMAVIRIPSKTTEILVSLSAPVSIDPQSSSFANITASFAQQNATRVQKTFELAVKTLEIKDWSLFQ